MKYWEIIRHNLFAAGWSWGYCGAVSPRWLAWIVNAHRCREQPQWLRCAWKASLAEVQRGKSALTFVGPADAMLVIADDSVS